MLNTEGIHSERTVRNYLGVLIQLSRYFGQSPEELTTEQIKEYLYHCKEKKGLSNSFINQTISALKVLWKDVLGKSLDDGIRIRRPRPNRHLPEVLSREEVLSMIEVTANLKHKAILAVLYSSGIRRDELLHLRLSDVDSKRMVIRVANGKGNRSRDTLLSPKTLEILRQYYQTTFPKPSHFVFEGRGEAGTPYSSGSVLKIVKRAANRAGIKKHVSPHSLRHAFATHMLEQGSNLKLIQKLLGHRSLGSTMIYLHLAAIDPSVKSPLD